MSEARKQAEEALAKWDEHDSYFRERGSKYEGMSRACARSLATALRALLAEPEGAEEGDVPEGDGGPWIACPDFHGGPHPATCPKCYGFGAIPETAPAPSPASDEVREAAERLLEEEYEAACNDRDAMARMVDDLRSTIRTMCSLITDWRDGNARLGRPRSFVDQRFMDALAGVKTDEITEVKLIVQGQRGGTATFTHWSGTATKSEEP